MDQPNFGQGSRRHLEPVPGGRPDPALNLSVLEPAASHPKKSGGAQITVNYKKLSKISYLNQLPIPRVDQILDYLGKGRMLSLFNLVSSFDQITAHKDTVSLTAFCAPTGLYERLVIPQGSSASSGWFVQVINEVVKGLGQVVAYLDDVIVFASDPTAHVDNIRALFERLCKYNLTFSPRRPASVPRMPIFLQFHPLVCVRTRTKFSP